MVNGFMQKKNDSKFKYSQRLVKLDFERLVNKIQVFALKYHK